MVIYYTGTGNSRIVAEKIASMVNDNIVCANDNIKMGKYDVLNSDKPWVFVSPTYAWQIPSIFKDYIKNTKFSGNNKAYFFMTCGTDIGAAGEYLKLLCNEKDFEYMGVKAIPMPENYVAMFPVPEEDETKEIVDAALKQLDSLGTKLNNLEKLDTKKPFIFAKIKSGIINDVFNKNWVSAGKFRVDENKCIGCGLCEKRCPVNCVKLINGKPVWGDNCCHCMACINGCPEIAIEYGRISVGKPRIYNGKAVRKNG